MCEKFESFAKDVGVSSVHAYALLGVAGMVGSRTELAGLRGGLDATQACCCCGRAGVSDACRDFESSLHLRVQGVLERLLLAGPIAGGNDGGAGGRRCASNGVSDSDGGVGVRGPVMDAVVAGSSGPSQSVVGGGGSFSYVEESESSGRADPVAGVGVRGPNYARNCARREEKKRKKAARAASELQKGSWIKDRQNRVEEEKGELRKSLEEKWTSRNNLEAMRARRQAQIMSAMPIEAEIQNRRTRLSRQTEANMVAIEKTHAKLANLGNVSSVMQEEHDELFSGTSRVHTVVDSGVASGSISPSSSVSEQEIRRLQKEHQDLLKEREEWLQWKAGATNVLKGVGFNADNAPFAVKRDWTLDGNGELSPEYRRVLNEMYEDDWAMTEYGSDYKLRYPEGKNMCRIHVIDQA